VEAGDARLTRRRPVRLDGDVLARRVEAAKAGATCAQRGAGDLGRQPRHLGNPGQVAQSVPELQQNALVPLAFGQRVPVCPLPGDVAGHADEADRSAGLIVFELALAGDPAQFPRVGPADAVLHIARRLPAPPRFRRRDEVRILGDDEVLEGRGGVAVARRQAVEAAEQRTAAAVKAATDAAAEAQAAKQRADEAAQRAATAQNAAATAAQEAATATRQAQTATDAASTAKREADAAAQAARSAAGDATSNAQEARTAAHEARTAISTLEQVTNDGRSIAERAEAAATAATEAKKAADTATAAANKAKADADTAAAAASTRPIHDADAAANAWNDAWTADGTAAIYDACTECQCTDSTIPAI